MHPTMCKGILIKVQVIKFRYNTVNCSAIEYLFIFEVSVTFNVNHYDNYCNYFSQIRHGTLRFFIFYVYDLVA